MRLDWRERAQLAHWATDHLHSPTIDAPETWPTRSRLRSWGHLPLYCGDHAIGLSGLYAVVNALKLLLAEIAPLQPAEERLLLEIGWRFMSGRAALAPHKGTRISTLARMAEAMAFALSRRRGSSIVCERFEQAPLPVQAMSIFLERSIVAKRVVLILLGGGHYTVLRGYTFDSWLLFDATGRLWMARRTMERRAMFKPILSLSRAW